MPPRKKINSQDRKQLRWAANRFRDHEGMSVNNLIRWFQQFERADTGLAMKLLGSVRYYSGADIRRMLRALVTQVFQRTGGIDDRLVYFVPVGNPGDSGSVLARALRHTPGVRPEQIRYMAELEKLAPADVKFIIFVDDFSGTGEQLEEWWAMVETIVRPKGASVVVALLVTNHLALPRIQLFANAIVSVHDLTEDDNVLSPISGILENQEKELVLDYCLQTDEPEKGYGDCGLLLAFRHGCPDNSLPILWAESPHWRGFFRRSGL